VCAADSPAPQKRTARDAVRDLLREIGTAAADPYRSGLPEGPQSDAYTEWLRDNSESVVGVRPGPLKNLPWGFSTFRPAAPDQPARLYLHVLDWHASGKLTVYGLASDVRHAFLFSDSNDLPVSKTDRGMIVTVPKQAPDAIDTVVVLELDGDPKTVSLAVESEADGKIVLHAKDAIVHGRTVRYEPEPHKNTVGYWTDASDWVHWEFDVKTPGAYAVEILQGCGKGSGGSTVDFSTAGTTLAVTVQDTGGFQNFVARPIGRVTFYRPGRYTLTAKPTRKPGLAVMDLRSVTLVPAGS
jgi:hypothetical protein